MTMRPPPLDMVCTLVRVVETVEDGDVTETEADGEESPCAIFPKTWTETNGRTVVETDTFDGFFPAGVDLEAVDRIRFRGEPLELAGRPARWVDPRSNEELYVQATLTRIA